MATRFLDLTLFHFFPCSKLTTTLTFGDLFKLMLPLGFATIAVLSVVSYMLTPHLIGGSPHWEGACVVALGAISGVGLSLATYGFHRHASSFAIEENYNNNNGSEEGKAVLTTLMRQNRCRSIKRHAFCSTLMAWISIAAALFFGFVARDLHLCAHETCGPDVAWSGVAIVISIMWMVVTYLGYRDLPDVVKPETTTKNLDETAPVPAEDDSEVSTDDNKNTDEMV